MIDTIESYSIKQYLASAPRVSLTNDPLFKLVWSDDERELRTGTFAKFVAGVKVSEETRTDQALKYNWIKERWILEQWAPPDVTMMEELPNSNVGSYEPLYVFEDKDGNALPLRLDVIQFIIKQALKPKTSAMFKRSLYKENAAAKTQVANDYSFDVLNDEGPLVSQFHDGSAVLNAFDNKKDSQ